MNNSNDNDKRDFPANIFMSVVRTGGNVGFSIEHER